MVGNPNASLYTNRLIGLPIIPRFQTTIVRLDEPRFPHPSSISSSTSSMGDDDNGDSGNDSDDVMKNKSDSSSSNPENQGFWSHNSYGPSKRARFLGPNNQTFDRGNAVIMLLGGLGCNQISAVLQIGLHIWTIWVIHYLRS